MKFDIKSLLENKTTLYVVSFLAGTNLLSLLLSKKVNAVIFFIAVGYLTSHFNKNMNVILLVSLLLTNLLLQNNLMMLKEGFDDNNDDDDNDNNKSQQTGGKKKKKEKVKEPMSKINPKVISEEDSEDDDFKNEINYASTIEAAYDNLDNLLGSDALKQMTDDTKNLVDQQKKLMGNVKKIQPMMQNIMSMLNDTGIDSKNLMKMIGTYAPKVKGLNVNADVGTENPDN